ncbi:MAG TPA: galactokinase family protein [Gemmatimonadales bacterium]
MTQVSPVGQATSLFQERFGSGPAVVVSAPGRVNLLGDHSDDNGGPVLPFAIERRTAVAAESSQLWAVVSAVDGTVRVIEPDLSPDGSWTAYVSGVIRVLGRRALAPKGARLAIASTIPIGAGLGSSGALTVALTRALLAVAGRRLPVRDVAELAYRAERDEVGVRCGRAGQTVAALARPGYALLFETATGELTYLPFGARAWMLETGVVHQLSDGGANLRRQECDAALGMVREHGVAVEQLAAVPGERLPALLRAIPAPWSLRLKHVVTEVGRTHEAARALAGRDLPRVGRLLVEGHESLRRDFQSSCDEADHLVASVIRHGAWGARLTGAGWGGAVLALVPPEVEARCLAEVQEEFRKRFGRTPTIWATRAALGVRAG